MFSHEIIVDIFIFLEYTFYLKNFGYANNDI